jgi:hypothetical protein
VVLVIEGLGLEWMNFLTGKKHIRSKTAVDGYRRLAVGWLLFL